MVFLIGFFTALAGYLLLLAFFPKKFLENWQSFILPTFTFLLSLFLYFFVYSLTRNVAIAWIGQIAFLANPLIIMESCRFTTRPLASLIFSLSFVPLLYFVHYGGGELLAFALIGLAILILIHRFSLQPLAALTLSFALFQKSWIYLAVIASMALAIIVTKGTYLKVLWRDQSDSSLPPIAVLTAIPFALFAIAAVLWYYFGWLIADFSRMGIPSPIFESLGLWVLTLLSVWIFIRLFKFVKWAGEGELTMEFGAFPTAILTSLFVWNVYRAWPTWLVFAGFGLFILIAGFLPALFLQKKMFLSKTSE